MMITKVEGARQKLKPRKTWKEVVGREMNDLHLKPSDALIIINRRNSDSSGNSDAVS